MSAILVLEKIEKIEAELTSTHAMLITLTDTKLRTERRRFGVVTVRGLEHGAITPMLHKPQQHGGVRRDMRRDLPRLAARGACPSHNWAHVF